MWFLLGGRNVVLTTGTSVLVSISLEDNNECVHVTLEKGFLVLVLVLSITSLSWSRQKYLDHFKIFLVSDLMIV